MIAVDNCADFVDSLKPLKEFDEFRLQWMQCWIFGLELQWHFCGETTFPLTSISSLSVRKDSLQRQDSSLLNFDLKTAIDDGDEEDDGEEEEVLVFSVAAGDSNGLISGVIGVAGVSVIV